MRPFAGSREIRLERTGATVRFTYAIGVIRPD